MSQTTKKEEIQQFRSLATEEDFQKLKECIKKGEINVSIGRDKSRSLLRKTQATYYYSFFSLAIVLAAFTVYSVHVGNRWITGIGFATTLMVMIVFWRSMTRRMSAWSVECKNNFDYAYFSNVISIRRGEQEYFYPEKHWKQALDG